jgi:small subunit ribosomal protein S9
MAENSEDKTGGYYWGTGRRKCSRASVRLRPGSGHILINERPLEKFFGAENHRCAVTSVLRFAKLARPSTCFAA